MRALRHLGRLLRLDARQLMRERLSMVVLAIGTLCAAAGAWGGAIWIDRLERERAAFLADANEASNMLRGQLTAPDLDEATRVLLPTRVTRPVAFPVPTLADFSIGRSDIEPATATLRMRHRADSMFRNYQLDNAARLMRGRLDLAFVAVVIAPLLLIAVGFGVFSVDRERGTARLILSQAASLLPLLLVRSLNRLLLVLLPLVLSALALLIIGPDLPGRGVAAACWLGVAALGLGFWWAVILWVNSLRVGAESAAMALVGLWAMLVFVAPATINAGAQALHPSPSRLTQIVAARAAETSATQAYENDHAALAGDSPVALREVVRKNYRIGLAVDRRVAPGVEAFDRQFALQQATVERAHWLSPPMIVGGALAAIAGTDARTYAVQRREAIVRLAAFKRVLRGPVEQKIVFDAALDAQLPAFVANAPTRFPPRGVGWVLFVSLLCVAVAVHRFRRTVLA